MFRLLIVLLLINFISACERGNDASLIRMPVYGECMGEIEAFSEKLKNWTSGTDERINLKINRFDYSSEIHKDIIGYLEIKASNVENLNQYIKEIELMCFPRTRLEVDRDELGLRVIDDRRKQNTDRGITSYFYVTDDKYIMYYNQEYK